MVCMFPTILSLLRFVLWPNIWSWRMFHVYLRRIYILLLIKVSCVCLMISSVWSNLLLKSYSEFFHFSYHTSQFQKFYLVPFHNFCLFIYTLYLLKQCSPGFLWFFCSSYLWLFEHFKIVDLESLSNKPNVRVSPGTVLLFFSFEWAIHSFSLHAS